MKLSSFVVFTALSASAAACVKPPTNVTFTPASREEKAEEMLDNPVVAFAQPQDAFVRIAGPQMACTGTLIASNMVLTAHHCVVERAPNRRFTDKLIAASKLRVQLGGDYLPWGEVGVTAVVAPPCGEAGGRGDLAVLVLERKLVGMVTVPVRLEAPPKLGEVVSPVGFGRCALSPEGVQRRFREGGAVAATHPGTFDLDASICPGDSGGPVIVRDGMGGTEVVGVISLSVMDAHESTRALSVMTRVDPFRHVFAYARAIADGADASDLPPLSCTP